MSPPQNTRSNPSLQLQASVAELETKVALVAASVLELRDRASEDRANATVLRTTDQTFNEKTFALKAEIKPLVALFWTVLGGLILGLGSVVGTFIFRAMK